MNVFKYLREALRRHSIRTKMMAGFLVMLIGTGVINLSALTSTQRFLDDYHTIANRVVSANRLVPITMDTIESEAYYLVAGRKSVEIT